ncbi:MAG: Cytochrome ubiquinol oxidase subunit [Gemmatimonadetes bacterium]|nr:Cytochrome ubiquinol oxidase subunit [Gemmatimonadota bacterium]
MSGFLASIGLPEIVAGLIVLALNAYVLMGGADFGGGVWDLLAGGPRRKEQREHIASSIAPIWEANHVWLIIVVVMLFTAFPIVYATLATVLHIPLLVMLVGIVLRGSAFVFRSYGGEKYGGRRGWGLAFAVASTVTPILLGVIIGAVASGDVAAAAARVGHASFVDVFVIPWLAPFPIAVGLFALALFAFLAAVYLALGATDPELQNDFRRRALGAAAVVFVLAIIALLVARSGAPIVAEGVTGAPWAIALHLCTGAAAVTAILALWTRRYGLARIAAAGQVSFILWGWVLAQYPFVIPPALTIRQAAAPPVTLELLLIGLAAGAAILIPSLRYLFKTFAPAAK